MVKTLFVLFSFIFISQVQSQAQAQQAVEPKLIITNPGGGGYNLEQRVYELERSTQSLNQAVRDAYFRTSALERRLVELERKVNAGNGGSNGATVRCEMYVGASSLVEMGSDERETEQRLREGCRRELKSRECNFARVDCRRIGRR